MPTIKLNKQVFEKLVGKKLPIEKLKDRISMLGTDLESIDCNDIEVEIFPNRPDMLSEQGFARAFSSFIGVKTGLRKYDVKKSGHKMIVEKSLPKEYPYAYSCIVKELKFDDEKIREVVQIQEKLGMTLLRKRKKGGIGLYPLEKIKFPIKFLGRDPNKIKFRPLEYPNEITGMQILSKHPTGRTYAPLVEGWKIFPIFEDSNKTIMSMPPIINSHDVGKINETTKEIFLEVTGTDPHILKSAFNIMVTSLAEMGGQIYSIECKKQNGAKEDIPNLTPTKMDIDRTYCNKWLGLNLKEKEVKQLLEKMGFAYQNKKVLVPAYRADIMHQVDLFEDIAIAYGYENFEEEIPNVATSGEETAMEKLKNKIVETLVGLGLLELNTYNLANRKIQTELMNADLPLIEVANAVSTEYNVLRAWMLPCLLEIFKNNRHHEYPQKIFDIGTVFSEDKKEETNVKEIQRLAVAICEEKADYTKIRQIFDYLMRMLNLEYTIEETNHNSFINGRVARIKVDGIKVAYIGELNPQVFTNFGLEMPIACFELNLTEIYNLLRN